MNNVPNFDVYGAEQVTQWLKTNSQRVFDIVRDTYLAYHSRKADNPDSYFLRFSGDQRNRIIALPATIENETPVAGIKWIASFPENVEYELDRASAVVIVNNRKTGYPLACLEGSLISAARTAASAAIGVEYLHPIKAEKHIACLGVVGCGPIAFASVNLLINLGWRIGRIQLFDEQGHRTLRFSEKLEQRNIKITRTSLCIFWKHLNTHSGN